MKRWLLLSLLMAVLATVGCGGSAATPPANPTGPRPMPGGKNPDGSKTEWDQSGKTKSKR